jgi:integrase
MNRVPRVRLACPTGRPIQLRYSQDGREVRLSTGTTDPTEAERQKRELEARLLLGVDVPRRRRRNAPAGPNMPWDAFRDLFRTRHLSELRPRTRNSYESRLDIAERLMAPATLGDMADRDTLVQLRQKRVLATSPHYARSFMSHVLAALHWAESEGLLPSVPKIPRIKTSKLKAMKGRAISGEEFERMLAATSKVVGDGAAESYQHVLRGLWSSALRIGELMMVGWDRPDAIQPVWRKRSEPILRIPANLQKNNTEEEIPLLPWFESLLLETPERLRTGWVFNPVSMNGRLNRRPRVDRPSAEWVAKVVSRIGQKAKVVVTPGAEPKYASAHDLRRSCGQRLSDAGVPERVIQSVLRHESWTTTQRFYVAGNVQADARVLRETLNGSASTQVHRIGESS